MYIRSIFLMMLLFFWISNSLWANDEVGVSVSSKQVQVWESILVDIVFDPGVSQWEIELSIPWIEEFTVFSQSQQQRVQSINGNTATVFQYTLQIRPQQEGIFVLWPVQIDLWNKQLRDDEELRIQVWNSIQNIPEETAPSEEVLTEKPKLQPVRWYEMSSLFILWLIALFFIVFFILLKKYLETRKPNIAQEQSIVPLTQIERLQKYFQKLEKHPGEWESQELYRKVNLWLREIFHMDTPKLTWAETLFELRHNKKILGHWLFPVFEKTYFWEFWWHEFDAQKFSNEIQSIIQYLETLWK